tara:strand:+ start:2204 stop:3595 length:1392 start_codon:yes stop_codon:yes gene_type:complete
MKAKLIYVTFFIFSIISFGFNVFSNDISVSKDDPVAAILTVKSAIGPATTDYIQRSFDTAKAANVDLIVLQLDTPGGLDRSMRDIIQIILSSSIPVATYVSPSGARAASAGTYILYASHVAAMAPGTNLGAATPVSLADEPKNDDQTKPIQDLLKNEKKPTPSPKVSGNAKMRKAVNDATAYIQSLADLRNRNSEWAVDAVINGVSLAANDALEKNVVDIVADNLDDLFDQVDGMTVTVNAEQVQINTINIQQIKIDPDFRQKILSIISSPDLAYMLLIAGAYGLFLEFSNPGIYIAGISGSIAIIIAFYALQLFPIQYSGLMLVLLGLGLFIGELITPTFGVLTIGGTLAFIIGSFFLIDTNTGFPGISLYLIVIFTLINLGLLFIISKILLKSLRRPKHLGEESMINLTGRVIKKDGQRYQVLVRGEIWQAQSDVILSNDDHVVVTNVEGLVLIIKPVTSD